MERDVSLSTAGAQSSRAVHDLRGSEKASPEGREQRGQTTYPKTDFWGFKMY